MLKFSLIALVSLATLTACSGGGTGKPGKDPSQGPSVGDTTSLSKLTRNNTSAVDNFQSIWIYNNGSTLGNINQSDLHALLYPGSNTKITAHLMGWFGGDSHKNIGYKSDDPNQIRRQMDDMMARGISGVWIDWYGPESQENRVAQTMLDEASKRESRGHFTVGIVVDNGAINCKNMSTSDCVVDRIKYVVSTFGSNKHYPKDANGNPEILFFLPYGRFDWNYIVPRAPKNARLVFEDGEAFTYNGSSGGYTWAHPGAGNNGFDPVSGFYDTALGYLGRSLILGAAYKGFHDSPVNGWYFNNDGRNHTRFLDQRCGRTWLETFGLINSKFDSNRQLPELQLVTWNDYEEGTELETGVENCLGDLNPKVSGSAVTWSVNFVSPNGRESTIERYDIYVTDDTKSADPQLTLVGTVKTGTHSFSLASANLPSSAYRVFVRAVGYPGIHNHMSQGVTVNDAGAHAAKSAQQVKASGVSFGFAHINAPKDNAKVASPEVPLKANAEPASEISEITAYVDGESVAGEKGAVLNHTLNLPPGSHEIRVVAVDSDKKVYSDSVVVFVPGESPSQGIIGKWNGNTVSCSSGAPPNTSVLDISTRKPVLNLARDRATVSLDLGAGCVMAIAGQLYPRDHSFSAVDIPVEFTGTCAKSQIPGVSVDFKKRYTINGDTLKTFETSKFQGGVCPVGDVETQTFERVR